MQKADSFSGLCKLEVRLFYVIIYQVIMMPMDGYKSQMHMNFAICGSALKKTRPPSCMELHTHYLSSCRN